MIQRIVLLAVAILTIWFVGSVVFQVIKGERKATLAIEK